MSETADGLRGLNVLVLEDEAVIAMLLEDMLGDLGCNVVGPAAKVADALELVRCQQIGAALLDLNLGHGETGYPVADALAERAVPFAFVTGYGAETLQEAHRDRPTLQKPFRSDALQTVLARLRATA